MSTSFLLSAAAACVALACGGNTLVLGTDDGGTSGSSSGGRSGSGASSPLAGKWSGYIESFHFPSGDDALAMTFSFAQDGSLSGSVVFSNQPAPPPPTNPEVGYPPGLPAGGGPVTFHGEGFAYTALGVTFDGTRLQFGVETGELWKAWCQLQTKTYGLVDGGGPPFGCLPNTGFGEDSMGCFVGEQPNVTYVDCGKLALCGGNGFGVCQCTATSCTVPVRPPGDVTFDMQLSGDRLDGSLAGPISSTGGTYNVHLTRTP